MKLKIEADTLSLEAENDDDRLVLRWMDDTQRLFFYRVKEGDENSGVMEPYDA